MSEHALTMRDVPVIEIDGRRLPVFFPVRQQEEWAAHLGQTLDELLTSGLPLARLVGADLREMLARGLAGGEARRHALEGGQALTVDDAVLDRILDLYAWSEVSTIVMQAWNWPPSEPDPQTPSPATAPDRESPSQSPSSTASPDSMDSD